MLAFGINVPVATVVVYVVVSQIPPDVVYVDVRTMVVMYVVEWNPDVGRSDTTVPLATLSLVTGKNGRVVSGIVVRKVVVDVSGSDIVTVGMGVGDVGCECGKSCVDVVG